MKKLDPKKTHFLKRWFDSQFATPFKRAFGMIGDESEPTLDLRVSTKESLNTFLTYDGHQRMNAQLLEMEMHKAEAIQAIRERPQHT